MTAQSNSNSGGAALPVHLAERVIVTHLADKGSTIASVGALYALCISARPTLDRDAMVRIHNAARARFQPRDDKAWMSQLDRIKKAGWKLHDALAARPSATEGSDG